MKFRADLPVKKASYAVNTHYVELEDFEGNVHRLLPEALVKFECNKCHEIFYMTAQHSRVFCPVCNHTLTKGVWGKLQLSFTPEKETDFKFQVHDPKS